MPISRSAGPDPDYVGDGGRSTARAICSARGDHICICIFQIKIWRNGQVKNDLALVCGKIISDAGKQNIVQIHQKDVASSEGNGSAVLIKKVEQHLIKGLKAKFCDHDFIGEETLSNEQ